MHIQASALPIMSFIRRVSGAVRARFSDADSKSARMLGDTEDAHALSGASGEEMYSVSSGTARVVNASSVNVAVARPRPEDTEHLRRRENVFFALFRKPQTEVQRVNPRIAASEWGEMNSLFISKLLVNIHFSPYLRPSLPFRLTRRPSSQTTRARCSWRRIGRQ